MCYTVMFAHWALIRLSLVKFIFLSFFYSLFIIIIIMCYLMVNKNKRIKRVRLRCGVRSDYFVALLPLPCVSKELGLISQ